MSLPVFLKGMTFFSIMRSAAPAECEGVLLQVSRKKYIHISNSCVEFFGSLENWKCGLRFELEEAFLVHIVEAFDCELDVAYALRGKGDVSFFWKLEGLCWGAVWYVQEIATTPAEILPHNNSHELQSLGMRRHSVSWYDPTSLAKLVGNRKLSKSNGYSKCLGAGGRNGGWPPDLGVLSYLIVVVVVLRVQAERYEREPFAPALGQDDEAKLLEG
jgi:hypothetical protein